MLATERFPVTQINDLQNPFKVISNDTAQEIASEPNPISVLV